MKRHAMRANEMCQEVNERTEETRRVMLRPREVSAALGLSRSKTYSLIQAGEIRSIRVGRAIRVPVAALDEFSGRGTGT